MTAYLWLKLVHVISAIVAVGTNLTYFVWLTRAKDQPQEEQAFVLRVISAIDARLANPAYVVLPVTGVLMVLTEDLGFTTFWIALAIGLYIVVGAFAGILFGPSLRRQIKIVQSDGPGSAEYAGAVRRTTLS